MLRLMTSAVTFIASVENEAVGEGKEHALSTDCMPGTELSDLRCVLANTPRNPK